MCAGNKSSRQQIKKPADQETYGIENNIIDVKSSTSAQQLKGFHAQNAR
jgi:hypothetical protein